MTRVWGAYFQTRVVSGRLPVMNELRLGQHMENWTYALANRRPSPASLSMLGVWTRVWL